MSHAVRQVPPVLVEGERLDRSAFHDRFLAMPPGVKAELVGGIVYIPSTLGLEHGAWDSDLSDFLGLYKIATPGVRKALNVTTQFGDYGEPQPDQILLIPEALGGQSRSVGGYVVGSPELVAEVSRSTRAYDLGPKKRDYERAGVLEYVVVDVDDKAVHWFVRRVGAFQALEPGPDGVYRSGVFPGLWLDPRAFFAGDARAPVAALERGLATPEHAAFVARLNAAAGAGPAP